MEQLSEEMIKIINNCMDYEEFREFEQSERR